jgi:endonuclease-3 related protein
MPDVFKRKNARSCLFEIYNLLYKIYGRRHWWPAETPFEVMVGAILTQNTNWSNVEKAITNLKKDNLLNPTAIDKLSHRKLARLIRPCGYYNIKAKRLKNFTKYLCLCYSGNLNRMHKKSTAVLRRELLNINGIGPETADSIILYALKKPIFVIDAYTRRITACMGIADSDARYEDIQSLFMNNLPKNIRLFNEYHALLVEHAKSVCKKKPRCSICILHSLKRNRVVYR